MSTSLNPVTLDQPRVCLLELAERCEQATGPDRELDGAIWAACCADPLCADHTKLGKLDWPRYTASLDAAMTLVPEGYDWGVGSQGNPDTDGPWAWCATEQQSRDLDLDYGKAVTPALALCAAALRAGGEA